MKKCSSLSFSGQAWVLALGLSAFLALSLSPAQAARRTVKIIRVIDGDTVVTSDKATLRLAGIDTPETGSKGRAGQPFSRAAKAKLERMVRGRRVEMELAEETRDRYGRLLAYIFLKGRLVNLELVEEGLARVYIIGPNTRYAAELIQAEQRARRAKKGLWEKWKGRWGR